jgi:4-hydroxy-3-polyprenylbenzoate decarboxylase
LIGEPVEVIAGPRTGLPIPAHAEIAFEGFVYPNDLDQRRSAWANGPAITPAAEERAGDPDRTFMHRNNPILMGAIPGVPPDDDSFYRGTYRSGAVWNQLEAAGIPEVKGVWAHEAGGSRLWLTGRDQTALCGHSKQAGLIASQCHAGAYANRFVVVVTRTSIPPIWTRCCGPCAPVSIRARIWKSSRAAGAPCSTPWCTAKTTAATPGW